MEQDNDPKYNANTTKDFIRGEKWTVEDWPSQSLDLYPIQHSFHLLKRRLRGETPRNKQELKPSRMKNATVGSQA